LTVFALTFQKSKLKSFTANSKSYLIQQVRQLDVAIGLYTNRNNEPLHQDALALYVSLNPRNIKLAQQNLLRRLVDVAIDRNNTQNPASLALSELQKARSRSEYIDFDFDIGDDKVEETARKILTLVGKEAVTFLKTRGGFHAFVRPKIASNYGFKKWHNEISYLPGCDVVGDSLIPVPGSSQGGFVPHFFNIQN